MGLLSCHDACVCRPAVLNTTSHYKATFSKFSEPVWATVGSGGTRTVRVVLDVHASGRLMLTAATFSAPLPGSRNSSIYFKAVGDTLNQNTF